MKNCPYPIGSLNFNIYMSLWYYPMLFKNGGQVLHHMFCVLGNGLDWEKGCLTDAYEEDADKNVFRSENEIDKHYYKDYPHMRREDLLDLKKENSDRQFVRENAEELTLDIYRPWEHLYPLCEYSNICTLPADAKPEYVEACRVCIDLAYEAIFEGKCYKQKKSGKHKSYNSTNKSIEWADIAQKNMIEKFGNRTQPDDRRQSYKTWVCFDDYVKFRK